MPQGQVQHEWQVHRQLPEAPAGFPKFNSTYCRQLPRKPTGQLIQLPSKFNTIPMEDFPMNVDSTSLQIPFLQSSAPDYVGALGWANLVNFFAISWAETHFFLTGFKSQPWVDFLAFPSQVCPWVLFLIPRVFF